MTENEISKIVSESALKVHKVLGPGLLRVPEECLFYELKVFKSRKTESALIYEEVKLDRLPELI
jgi:Zn-dependent M32 family carboxypeptidase